MNQDMSLAEVIEANDRFYAALRNGDMAGMEALWSTTADVSVYHPNWPGIFGLDEVMSSWRTIMLVFDAPAISARIYSVVRTPRTAVVFCVEEIGHARGTASNVFSLEADGWRLVSHHARPLPVTGSDGDDDLTEK